MKFVHSSKAIKHLIAAFPKLFEQIKAFDRSAMGVISIDQMDLLVEQVKMLAGEIAFSSSTRKRLVEQSANDPESSKSQIENLEREIEEKRRQMRVMEKQIIESNEASISNTSLADMQQMKKVKRKPRQPLDLSAVRRSNRVADKPPQSYKEVPIEPLGRIRSYGKSARDLSNRVYASYQDREYASERAEELHSTLQTDFPSFVKPMLQSHVSGGFWLVRSKLRKLLYYPYLKMLLEQVLHGPVLSYRWYQRMICEDDT